MIREHDLRAPAGANHDRKRVGRGIAAGQGKTAGKGTKGQKARAGGSIRRGFQGGQNPIQQQLPYKRGFVNKFRVEYNEVNVSQLDVFPAETEVTVEMLFARRLARKRTWPVKILGEGEISKALTVQAHKFTGSAQAKIEAAGGHVTVINGEAAANAEPAAEA